uniref:G-protein coupled receptors family 2 profile 2 domain-containing protein n=1 Tax=Myripristis murdjan TaxID=586833 RepID=A0A667Y2B5_9TELE
MANLAIFFFRALSGSIIWRKVCNNNTLRLYHVSIVNIAVCLLIADIWFIIAAAISSPNVENPPACRAATFFIHFFYLALFFWMLASALFVLYYSVHVFDGVVSEHAMAIGFSLGYGAPLIIAIITIAVTAPNNQYVQRTGVCWLNWDESKALLAFVIPALLIVVVNLFILVVVMCKIFSSRGTGNATSAHQNHVLLSIARNLVVLTPLFGTTWCLGIGTMISPRNEGIHIAFAVFNSLQVCDIKKLLIFLIYFYGGEMVISVQCANRQAAINRQRTGSRPNTPGSAANIFYKVNFILKRYQTYITQAMLESVKTNCVVSLRSYR